MTTYRCHWTDHLWSVRVCWDGREITVCEECGTEMPNQEQRRTA